jgi:hypothetical protein
MEAKRYEQKITQVIDGKPEDKIVVWHWRNSMRSVIRNVAMSAKFATEDHPDMSTRENFCAFMAYADDVDGLPLVDETSDLQAFEDVYHQYLDAISPSEWREAIAAMNTLFLPTANIIEKPDAAITDEEIASDPN